MKLTNKQKQYLLDNDYVTVKALGVAVEPGWKDYFIKSLAWEFAGIDIYGFKRLYLIDKGKRNIKDKGNIVYKIWLNFQNDDYKKFQNIRG